MNPIKVKGVVVVEIGTHDQLDLPVSFHTSRNPMWSAWMHIKALKKRNPDKRYTRFRVDGLIARSNELADKIQLPATFKVETEFRRAEKLYGPPL